MARFLLWRSASRSMPTSTARRVRFLNAAARSRNRTRHASSPSHGPRAVVPRLRCRRSHNLRRCLSQHADEHRSKDPVRLAVDQQLAEGSRLGVPPVGADRVDSVEVGSVRTWSSSAARRAGPRVLGVARSCRSSSSGAYEPQTTALVLTAGTWPELAHMPLGSETPPIAAAWVPLSRGDRHMHVKGHPMPLTVTHPGWHLLGTPLDIPLPTDLRLRPESIRECT